MYLVSSVDKSQSNIQHKSKSKAQIPLWATIPKSKFPIIYILYSNYSNQDYLHFFIHCKST